MIRTIVQEELRKPRDTLVIRPALNGRKFEGSRSKISCLVDGNIESALRAKAKEMRVPVGVVIESALYEYLGRPRLSFEKEKP